MAQKQLINGIDHLLLTMLDCLDTPGARGSDCRNWLLPLWRSEIEPHLATATDIDFRMLHRCRILARVSGRWPAMLRKLEAAIPESTDI